jgi:hypothetical protein
MQAAYANNDVNPSKAPNKDMQKLLDASPIWSPDNAGQFNLFIGIDLAPNEQLETGIAVMDRNKGILRLDKFYKDTELTGILAHLNAPQNTMVLIDLPRNLQVPSKFRQEELKMHASRMTNLGSTHNERFAKRARNLFNTLYSQGYLPYLTLLNWTKLNYNIFIPFRARSSQGGKALQTALTYQLGISGFPNQQVSNSTLEAILAAYTGWSLWKDSSHVECYLDTDGTPTVIGRQIVPQSPKKRYSRGRRIYTQRPTKASSRSSATSRSGATTTPSKDA